MRSRFRQAQPAVGTVLNQRSAPFRQARPAVANVKAMDLHAALARVGVRVPQPIQSLSGERCVSVNGRLADMLTFLDAQPLMSGGQWNRDADLSQCAGQIGATLARLHDLSDGWQRPEGFTRPHWDTAGLIGAAPLWGSFWENPVLTPTQADLFTAFRDRAAQDLAKLGPDLDYGLIHADAVPENVMVSKDGIFLIDFDDGGFGRDSVRWRKRKTTHDQHQE